MVDLLTNPSPNQVPTQPPLATPLPSSLPVPSPVLEPVTEQRSAPLPPQDNKKKLTIVLTIIVLLIISIVAIAFINRNKQSITLSHSNEDLNATSTSNTPKNLVPAQSQAPFSECTSPLAPSNVRPYVKCYYRNTKISFTEAKAVQDRIIQTVGSISIPKDLVFVHEEVYRGIPIKWTSGQPISPNVLTWLKVGLDILPDYFFVEHPLTSIISATDKELGSPTVIKPGPSTLAFASGLNIFLTETTAKGGSTYYPTDQSSVVHTLFHEWVHVVQHYEALETFTEEYLAKNTIVEAMATGPLEKGFAKEVGWVYNSDEFGDGIIAKLKEDAMSQKTTEYGRTKVREDMAESGALFMECKSSEISEARTLWWEKITGKNRAEFCPSKI